MSDSSRTGIRAVVARRSGPAVLPAPARGLAGCLAVLLVLGPAAAGCERDGGRLHPAPNGSRGSSAAPEAPPSAPPPAAGEGAPATGLREAGMPLASRIPEAIPPLSSGEAEALYHQARYGDARDAFRDRLDRGPASTWDRYMLGLSSWKAGDLVEAERELRGALEAAPGFLRAEVNLARVLLDDGRPDEAREIMERAAAAHPGNAEAHRVAGRAFHSLGLAGDAEREYRAALALDPRDAWALNNLGFLLLERGRDEEAVAPLVLATRIRSEVALFHRNLGAALERCGDTEAAAAAYRAAEACDPGGATPAAGLARTGSVASTRVLDLASMAERFEQEVAGSAAASREAVPARGAVPAVAAGGPTAPAAGARGAIRR